MPGDGERLFDGRDGTVTNLSESHRPVPPANFEREISAGAEMRVPPGLSHGPLRRQAGARIAVPSRREPDVAFSRPVSKISYGRGMDPLAMSRLSGVVGGKSPGTTGSRTRFPMPAVRGSPSGVGLHADDARPPDSRGVSIGLTFPGLSGELSRQAVRGMAMAPRSMTRSELAGRVDGPLAVERER